MLITNLGILTSFPYIYIVKYNTAASFTSTEYSPNISDFKNDEEYKEHFTKVF